MVFNKKIILISLLSISLGLSIGYFVFSNKQSTIAAENSNHTHEDMGKIWTCSMHPQIRQNSPGECPLCGMDLTVLEENSSDDPLVLKMTEAAVKLSDIQTILIGKTGGESGHNLRLSGKIKVDERLSTSLVAHIPGRIDQLYLSFTGENIRKGQKIARLYSPELISAQRELLEAVKLQDVNPSLLEAARNKLRFWKISNDDISKVEQSEIIKESFIIYADQSGVVANKRVNVGDYVQQGGPLFDLISISKLWVVFDAYEEDLPGISVGDYIEFTTPAAVGQTFKTQITFIDPIITAASRVASVRAEINNTNGHLKPEMFVNGILYKTMEASTQMSIPKTAVLWTGKRSVVYVKLPDTKIPSYEYREVELGENLGKNYELLDGLAVGERIVTNGNFVIDAAAQLNNQASMMNKNVSLKKEQGNHKLPDYRTNTADEFKQQLKKITEDYLILKDALVAADQKHTSTAAIDLNTALAMVDMTLLNGDAHLYWMQQQKALNAHSKLMMDLDDLEQQRKQFDFFSQVYINTIKVFGSTNDTLYVEHCPMANDNNGADWLSREAEIRNPYFGDKMLRCGFVKDTIK